MRGSLCTLAVLAAACSSARADSWALHPEIKRIEHRMTPGFHLQGFTQTLAGDDDRFDVDPLPLQSAAHIDKRMRPFNFGFCGRMRNTERLPIPRWTIFCERAVLRHRDGVREKV